MSKKKKQNRKRSANNQNVSISATRKTKSSTVEQNNKKTDTSSDEIKNKVADSDKATLNSDAVNDLTSSQPGADNSSTDETVDSPVLADSEDPEETPAFGLEEEPFDTDDDISDTDQEILPPVHRVATSAPSKKVRSRSRYARKEHKKDKTQDSKGKKIVKYAFLFILIAAFTGYIVYSLKYMRVFFPNTSINGVDVSGMTVGQAQSAISQQIDGYSITVMSRGNENRTISGDDIGLSFNFSDTVEKKLHEQIPPAYVLHLFRPSIHNIGSLSVVDDSKFNSVVYSLPCLQNGNFVKPADAYISEYISGSGYQIIPATQGNVLKPDEAANVIKKAVLSLSGEVNLDSEGLNLYETASVSDANSEMISACDLLNHYSGARITYVDSKDMVLDGDTISTWLGVDSSYNVTVDQNAIIEYVKDFAALMDTYGKTRRLKTTWGDTVDIEGGIAYGWEMDQNAEIQFINETLLSGEQLDREPSYLKTAASHGENDFGDTYVEINITAQHLYYYKDGQQIVSSDLVSGCTNKKRGTPSGFYTVAYKQRHATLRGQGYASPVDYWMPFNNGIGLHDASWRSSFGGNIYKSSGSHGCINLPYNAAKTIYENIEAGCPVIVYTLDGSDKTTTTSSSSGSGQKSTQKATQPAATAATDPTVTESATQTSPVSTETSPAASTGSDKGPGFNMTKPTEESTQIGPTTTDSAPVAPTAEPTTAPTAASTERVGPGGAGDE